jgi:hypothetical protein
VSLPNHLARLRQSLCLNINTRTGCWRSNTRATKTETLLFLNLEFFGCCLFVCFVSFASINVLYYIYRFAYVKPLLHPWDEANLVVKNDLSNILLDSVCHYFIEYFCINVH